MSCCSGDTLCCKEKKEAEEDQKVDKKNTEVPQKQKVRRKETDNQKS